MAWTAGITRTTGDLISAADWNGYLGASGSLDYLKINNDKVTNIDFTMPSRDFDVGYQNGSQTRIVICCAQLNSQYDAIYAKVGPSDPPANTVAYCKNDSAIDITVGMTFFVEPSQWYEITTNGSPVEKYIREWNIH